MGGYPFFYGNETLDQDEKFMIFSLDPITENSELILAQLVTLPVLGEPVNIELGNEFTYKFCDQISEICGSFYVIPETETMVFDYEGFSKLVSKSDLIINNVSSELLITSRSALEQAQNFFSERNVTVQAGGVQGAVYKVGSYLQSAGSAGILANTIGMAKLAGVGGVQILKAQPYLFIALPMTGAMFFYGCGSVVGNNIIGKSFITTGDVLALPMKGMELMWNSYGNPVIQKVFGIPVILNMTQTFKTGPGYTIEEICRYIPTPFDNKSLVKVIKEKIISWLS